MIKKTNGPLQKVGLISIVLLLPVLSGCEYFNAKRPKNLGIAMREGIKGGQNAFALAPCEASLPCVSSYHQKGTKNYLEPIEHEEPMTRAYEKILTIGTNYPKEKTRMVSKTDNYIYFEFTWGPGITDDVEFFFGEGGKVHFRSASRAIPYDLGANKKRIEDIRFRFFQNDF